MFSIGEVEKILFHRFGGFWAFAKDGTKAKTQEVYQQSKAERSNPTAHMNGHNHLAEAKAKGSASVQAKWPMSSNTHTLLCGLDCFCGETTENSANTNSRFWLNWLKMAEIWLGMAAENG